MARRSIRLSWLDVQLSLRRIGWLPMISLLVFLIAATIHFVIASEVNRRIQAMQELLFKPDSQFPETGMESSLAARHETFRARLASPEERSGLLKSLFKEAAVSGVILAQGDYVMQANVDCNCRQLQITLPVRGTYPQIRTFVDSLLEKLPALSLDEITFRRDSVKNATVESRLRLSIYFRGLSD